MHEHGREAEVEREREKEKENLKQAPHSVQSLTQGWIPQSWDHDLSQNQEWDVQPTETTGRSRLYF